MRGAALAMGSKVEIRMVREGVERYKMKRLTRYNALLPPLLRFLGEEVDNDEKIDAKAEIMDF